MTLESVEDVWLPFCRVNQHRNKLWSKQNNFWSLMCKRERYFFKWNSSSILCRVKYQKFALFQARTQNWDLKISENPSMCRTVKVFFQTFDTNLYESSKLLKMEEARGVQACSPGKIGKSVSLKFYFLHSKWSNLGFVNNLFLHVTTSHKLCWSILTWLVNEC